MRKYSIPEWFKNISIARKLYFAVGVMALLIAMELFTLLFSINTLSSVRAFVGGEGLWSKSQKDAAYNLRKYTRTGNKEDYLEFQRCMKVPLGDRKTLMEMRKANPDMAILRNGFIEGRNHPDDVDGMINLLRRFHSISYISKAIKLWTEADSSLSEMQKSAEEIHVVITGSGVSSPEKTEENLNRINEINKKLTILEDEFSSTLGEGSRWLENLILRILLIIAITVEVSGLWLTISISRNISKGINEIIRVSEEVAKGNFKTEATIYSKDEIGKLASSFNAMIVDLEQKIKEREKAEAEILLKSEELIHSNNELEHFAYVASHDLQEPLRTITNYVGLFQKQYNGKLEANADEYLHFINDATVRMQLLIKDLLDYSRIGAEKNMTEIDCNKILGLVLTDMAKTIEDTGSEIKSEPLPKLKGYPELKSLFQNLISNAIKYRKKDVPAAVRISAKETSKEWVFSVKDNGIGIDPIYHERIFIIFQKLHGQKEYEGTGIGLTQCKKIVGLHGGKIWLESEVEKGSTFYFTIPKPSYT